MKLLTALQNIDRKILYLVLILGTTIPLYLNVPIPTTVSQETKDLYEKMMALPEGSTVILESDWTNSSRGESAGQLEAILRILHFKKAKFVLYSAADAQAPQVARNTIIQINKEFKGSEFRAWEDYVDLGFFPQAESIALSMFADIKGAWRSRQMSDTAGVQKSVFDSPVLKGVTSLADFKLMIIVTASGTPNVFIQRFGSPSKVPLAAAVTGVMGPETLNYYQANQLVGVSIGLRGVVELETLMKTGVNAGKGSVIDKNFGGTIAPLEGKTLARGMQYFLSLHAAMTLLIVFVVLGNLGIIVRRKGGQEEAA